MIPGEVRLRYAIACTYGSLLAPNAGITGYYGRSSEEYEASKSNSSTVLEEDGLKSLGKSWRVAFRRKGSKR